MRLILLALLLCVALPSFANDEDTVRLPKDAIDAPVETQGTVIGTIGFRAGMKETKMTWASFKFRKIGSSEVGEVKFVRPTVGFGGNTDALEDGAFKFAAFKMALPEGRYEIIQVLGYYNTTPFGYICTGECGIKTGNSEAFSVPFEVVRGKTLYLGSFLAHGTVELVKLGFIPMPVPSTVYFSYADKWQRDQPAFGAEGKFSVDANAVEHVTLSVNANAAYYIIAEDHLPEPRVKMKDMKSGGRATFAGKIAEYKAAHPDDDTKPAMQTNP